MTFLQMIDTVILRLKYPDFEIQDTGAFTPNCWGFFSQPYTPFNGSTYIKCTQNPTKLDKQNNNYKPRLTLIKRLRRAGQFEIELKIEFSVPKLLFGNNFRELEEADFGAVITTLTHKLLEMSVSVAPSKLREADVATIHYGKNFCFTDHTTASSLITELGKVDLTRRLDLNHTHFRNDGKALYYYAQNHSLVFYDKVQDLKQSETRASEKDNGFNLQTDIFETIRRQRQVPLEVLRMEVRLCSRVKMKQLFKTYRLEPMLTFANLFNRQLAQTVLLDYWDKLHNEARQNALLSRTPLDLLEAVLKLDDLTPQKALSLFACLELSKTVSDRKLNDLLSERFTPRSWQRLKKLVRSQADQVVCDRYTAFDRIRQDLLDFKAVKRVKLNPNAPDS